MTSIFFSKVCVVVGVLSIALLSMYIVIRTKDRTQSIKMHYLFRNIATILFFMPFQLFVDSDYTFYPKLILLIGLFIASYLAYHYWENYDEKENASDSFMSLFTLFILFNAYGVYQELNRSNLERSIGKDAEFHVLISRKENGEQVKAQATINVKQNYSGDYYSEEDRFGNSVSYEEDVLVITVKNVKTVYGEVKFNECEILRYKKSRCRDSGGRMWYISATDSKI